MSDDAMPVAVADLILRQLTALLEEGIGPRAYVSGGEDQPASDRDIILKAARTVGVQNLDHPDLTGYLTRRAIGAVIDELTEADTP